MRFIIVANFTFQKIATLKQIRINKSRNFSKILPITHQVSFETFNV